MAERRGLVRLQGVPLEAQVNKDGQRSCLARGRHYSVKPDHFARGRYWEQEEQRRLPDGSGMRFAPEVVETSWRERRYMPKFPSSGRR